MELGESPAAPANDTSVWSIGDSLAWRPLFSNIGHLVEHLGRCPVAQGLTRLGRRLNSRTSDRVAYTHAGNEGTSVISGRCRTGGRRRASSLLASLALA